MLTQQAIIDFCNQYDYDIRKSGNDYDFEVRTYPGYTTADVFPAGKIDIEAELRRQLLNRRLPNSQINVCLDMFNQGYNLLF